MNVPIQCGARDGERDKKEGSRKLTGAKRESQAHFCNILFSKAVLGGKGTRWSQHHVVVYLDGEACGAHVNVTDMSLGEKGHAPVFLIFIL